MRQKCSLVLSNGQIFEGDLIGAPVKASGELVFTTGMVGYSEALTDPSYFGQILTFTYPLIGNYGVPNRIDSQDSLMPKGFESHRTQVAAVIVSLDSENVFHWESFQSLDEWLKSENIPGIMGIDTRHLVHLIRSHPQLLGRIEPQSATGYRYAVCEEKGFFDPGSCEIIGNVSCKEPFVIGSSKVTIGVIDCGIKWNILRRLAELDCRLLVLPWNSDLSLYQSQVDGWLLSNGPGDPNQTGGLEARVRNLFNDHKPILGICLGHQILALAAGARTFRMAYGHRSHNQPVYQPGTRKGYMTTQNHGYVVDASTLSQDWEVWFKNANDESVEGIRHKFRPFRSVQFHPEASGGPRDTAWILEQFVGEVKKSCH